MPEDVLGTINNLLKEGYPEGAIGDTLLTGSWLYAKMQKQWGHGGQSSRVVVKDASGDGIGSDFEQVQEAEDEAQRSAFQVSFHDYTGLFRITEKSLALAEGNEDRLVDVLEETVDDRLAALKREIHWSMWRDGGGARGRIASGSGTTTLQLANPADAVHFARNMMICSDDTDGTGVTPEDDGEYVRILRIDKRAGTITKAGGNWNANGNFVANDYLFRRGTIGGYARGIRGWIPPANPTSTPWYGVDRSVAPTDLAGIRDAATAEHGTIHEALVWFAGVMGQHGARPSDLGINPRQFAQLVREMGEQARYQKFIPNGKSGMAMQGHVGFEYITITVGSGPIAVFSDPDVPWGFAWFLDLPTWRIRGPYEPKILTRAGNMMHPIVNGPLGYEGRMACFLQIWCNAPGKNGVLDLTQVLDEEP